MLPTAELLEVVCIAEPPAAICLAEPLYQIVEVVAIPALPCCCARLVGVRNWKCASAISMVLADIRKILRY